MDTVLDRKKGGPPAERSGGTGADRSGNGDGKPPRRSSQGDTSGDCPDEILDTCFELARFAKLTIAPVVNGIAGNALADMGSCCPAEELKDRIREQFGPLQSPGIGVVCGGDLLALAVDRSAGGDQTLRALEA